MRCRKKIKAKKVSTRKKTGDDWEHPRKRTKEVIQEIPISLLQLLNTANVSFRMKIKSCALMFCIFCAMLGLEFSQT